MNGLMGTAAGDDPDWVVAHEMKKKREDLTRHEEELRERVNEARRKLKASKVTQSTIVNKRSRLDKAGRDSDEDSDSAYLIQEVDIQSRNDLAYLSPAVRALMEQMEPVSNNEKKVKPFYAKRTGQDVSNEGVEEPETSPKTLPPPLG